MSIWKLAFQNFKRSVSVYLSLILSMAFTILVFVDFQNIVYSDLFSSLGEVNKRNIEMLINTVCVVLLVFLFFFLWYATNVFLERRKKEIGIYVFMGLTNQRIGQMYLLETLLIGIAALGVGLGGGFLFGNLFQMILFAMSDIAVDLNFRFSLQAVGSTFLVYGIMYGVFACKGYINIVRSSVLGMITASRQNEYVRQNGFFLMCKAVLGLGVLLTGYYYAVKDGGQEVIGNVLLATVLVIVGVYLLFGGLIPVFFQGLVKCKRRLYRRERVLWMNSMVFRMKKNYRTYAMTCVLMTCSVTALAAGFAMKNRYENMVRFRNTYTFQFLSEQEGLEPLLAERIEKENDIIYRAQVDILSLGQDLIDTGYQHSGCGLLRYSQVAALAENVGLKPLKKLAENEVIGLSRIILMSLITEKEERTVTINGKDYREIDDSTEPYLGYFQEIGDYYVVSDKVYEELLPLGTEMYSYSYGIADRYNYEASMNELDDFMEAYRSKGEGYTIGRVAINPNDNEDDWIKVMYSLCNFLFMVFILASGSILFMKLYNDAFEEKERYAVLRKIGCDWKALRRSMASELCCAYAMPFLVMAVSAFFSVWALKKMMDNVHLLNVYLASLAVVLGCFLLFYLLSVTLCRKNIGDE